MRYVPEVMHSAWGEDEGLFAHPLALALDLPRTSPYSSNLSPPPGNSRAKRFEWKSRVFQELGGQSVLWWQESSRLQALICVAARNYV
jgi:hypothetical protein